MLSIFTLELNASSRGFKKRRSCTVQEDREGFCNAFNDLWNKLLGQKLVLDRNVKDQTGWATKKMTRKEKKILGDNIRGRAVFILKFEAKEHSLIQQPSPTCDLLISFASKHHSPDDLLISFLQERKY
jgi:hypothetical protein